MANMQQIVVATVIITLGGSACTVASTSPPTPVAPAMTQAETKDHGPILAELFTSQGCSSCPPADALLSQLAKRNDVLPLSFHVDYWNRLGWNDPFSLPAWSERQQQYATTLADAHGVYTPELIVNGRVSMVGSQRSLVETALSQASAPALLVAKATWSIDSVTVDVSAPADNDVWLAIYDHGLATDVPSGENAGTTMITTNPVRKLTRIATPAQHVTTTVTLPKTCVSCDAVAFSQPAQHPGAIIASINLPR
jgi:hypothetical protein